MGDYRNKFPPGQQMPCSATETDKAKVVEFNVTKMFSILVEANKSRSQNRWDVNWSTIQGWARGDGSPQAAAIMRIIKSDNARCLSHEDKRHLWLTYLERAGQSIAIALPSADDFLRAVEILVRKVPENCFGNLRTEMASGL